MFLLRQPSMAINDHRKVGSNQARLRYNMWETWDLNNDGMPVMDIVARINRVAASATGGRLENLVINCHGFPGFLQVGAGISTRDIPLFRDLQGKIGTLYIQACLVARIITAHEIRERIPVIRNEVPENTHVDDGNMFSSMLARTLGCVLVVPTSIQWFYGVDLPFGTVDEYEGLVLWYGPNGSVIQSVRYPYITAPGTNNVLANETLANPTALIQIRRYK
jgi:hypothetical protein